MLPSQAKEDSQTQQASEGQCLFLWPLSGHSVQETPLRGLSRPTFPYPLFLALCFRVYTGPIQCQCRSGLGLLFH